MAAVSNNVRLRHLADIPLSLGGVRYRRPARGKLTIRNLCEAVVLAFNLVLWVGFLSDYRGSFWRAAYHALKRGQIDAALGMGLVAYHLIQFSREVFCGDQNASFYSARLRTHAAEQSLR